MKARTSFITLFCFFCIFAHPADRAVLVHNTLKDLENCKGKLQLKLIRVWGGDEEEDENKFFKTPINMVIDNNQLIYICDWHGHCIKVFDYSGRYLRTIGRKGQGPGDLYGPRPIDITPEGDLLVCEWGGRRFQWFSIQGKSKRILKYNIMPFWIGVTSDNEIAVYDSYKTLEHRRLISVINNKGKVLKQIGKYHCKDKNHLTSEKLQFLLDDSGNIYAANELTPVIRKYSPGGKLIMAITFEIPFEKHVEITLNSKGDEIERKEEIEHEDDFKIIRTDKGVMIQKKNKGTKRKRYPVCVAIGIDSLKRIYIVSLNRLLTDKEKTGTFISGGSSGMNREMVNFDLVENIDVNLLLVFDKNGKIIAQSPMTTLCDGIYIHNNRIFVIDGLYNQRILEYVMIFANKQE